MSFPWVVVKFGGTSVSDRNCWESIVSVVRAHRAAGFGVMVVCSAMSGASDQLTKLGTLALIGEHKAALASLVAQYAKLADELQVSGDCLEPLFDTLKSRLDGVACLRELTPKTQADIMAVGERALTALGTRYLRAADLDVSHWDATDLLVSAEQPSMSAQAGFLSAICDVDSDEALQSKCAGLDTPLVITQGFLAANSHGETVLLGRGGSDVSAAYLAAKLNAKSCEIWTDVAGVYSADPRVVRLARVILSLGYDEAQEIAAMGGKVLHPSSLAPLKTARIPLWIKKTKEPEARGTCVTWDLPTSEPGVKAISVKKDVVLVSIEGVSMWRSVGFLVDVFACFKKHGLSVDLLSTAESCITVSLDRRANLLDATALEQVLADLNCFATAKTIGPCAAVSLVGSGIRAILSDLSEVLNQFQSHQIYLLSQAANDLNLTFVVDEERADRLCQQIHHVLIENQPPGVTFAAREAVAFPENEHWSAPALAALASLDTDQLPMYFYSAATICRQIERLKSLSAVDSLYYAIKANSSSEVLSLVDSQGVHLECVSQGEIEHVLRTCPNIDKSSILFTPNFAPKIEYAFALGLDVQVTLDSMYPLQEWPELFAGKDIFLRLDPGQGRGHHKHVMTAGQSAKFGIPPEQLPELKVLAEQAGARVVGLHAHAGSGVLDPTHWHDIAYFLADFLPLFPGVRVFNCGGGLGIVQSPWQQALDLDAVNAGLLAFKKDYPDQSVWLEPGRFLVAESGVLLARVTQLKNKGDKRYIGIETGMNNLLRPALYGAYHPIVNLSRHGEPLCQEATVVGPICESADIIGTDRLLPETHEGDILAIGLAGAYGECMSSDYNMRPRACVKLD